MPLQLITGRANAGKTGELNARLFASVARGESPILVMPSVADTRRALGELSAKAPVGVAVVALSRWANGLWGLHGDGRRIIGDASRGAFVKRAIEDAMPSALESVGLTPGFSKMIERTVATMAENPGSRPVSTDAMGGVARICDRYHELITGGGLVERADAWRALGAGPPLLPGTVAVNRFADFDEPTFDLLTGLAQVNQVCIALTWEEGFAPTRALDVTTDRLMALAEAHIHTLDATPPGELGELLNSLYAGSCGLRSTGAVRMGLAAGTEAEAALMARFAAETIASGTAPDRVVVALPNLGSVAPKVAAAFQAEELDFDIDVARPVCATPLGRTLDTLLMLALGGGDRTTALGVVLGPHSDIPAAAAADLDHRWRKKRQDDPSRLLRDVAGQEDGLLASAAAAIQKLARQPVNAESGRKWESLLELLVSAAARKNSSNGAETIRELAARIADDARTMRAIVGAVGEMASVAGTPFSASDLRMALRTVAAGGTSGEREGCVQITELSRLRSRRFDTVILGGLTAAEMPTTDPVSLEDDLRSVFAPGARGNGEDHARFAFYEAISRARSQLVLVRRDTDDRGTPVRPSVLWEEVVDAYRTPGEGSDDWPLAGPACVTASAADIARTAPVFTSGRRALRQQAVEGRCVVGAPARGEISDPSVVGELARIDVFSATAIEAYLQCPYRWFYERVVRPEEIDVEVDARAVGTIAHGMLKAFYDELPGALNTPRVTADNIDAAMALLARVVASADSGITAQGLAEELDLARATRWVATTVADDALVLPGFVPSDHELSFGGPGEAAVSLGGVAFKGRIDRVDISVRSVFVTDYKSSRQVSGHDKFAGEARVQPIVYALVAREASGLPVAGSVYRSLRSRRMRGFWRPDLLGGELAFGHEDDAIGETRFDELVAEAAERIEGAVAGIRAGRVPREPSDKKACGFCALKPQCGGAAQ